MRLDHVRSALQSIVHFANVVSQIARRVTRLLERRGRLEDRLVDRGVDGDL